MDLQGATNSSCGHAKSKSYFQSRRPAALALSVLGRVASDSAAVASVVSRPHTLSPMPPKKVKGAKAKKTLGQKKDNRGAGNARNNPRAFKAASGPKAMQRTAHRALEKQERQYHVALTDRSVEAKVPPPFTVVVMGPAGVGKTTVIKVKSPPPPTPYPRPLSLPVPPTFPPTLYAAPPYPQRSPSLPSTLPLPTLDAPPPYPLRSPSLPSAIPLPPRSPTPTPSLPSPLAPLPPRYPTPPLPPAPPSPRASPPSSLS